MRRLRRIPVWVYVAFGVVSGFAAVCLCAAIWFASVREIVPVKAVPAPLEKMMQPVRPIVEFTGPTEVPVEAKPEEKVVHEVSAVEVVAQPEEPLWKQHAKPMLPEAEGKPKLALVIDDMGVDTALTRRAMEILPAAVTFAFLPYGELSVPLAERSYGEGHEILLHMPMEPVMREGQEPDMGPGGLTVQMPADEIELKLMNGVNTFRHVMVGVNNHMGSRFTGWESGMRVVLTVLQREGLLFLDSRTLAPTATATAKQGLSLPVLGRDVFLDHEEDPVKVKAELEKAVRLAKKKGFAIAIGHPLPVTLDVLEAELPKLASDSVVLVPLTAGIR